MLIKVTADHIDKGQWNNPLHSPIALALKDVGFRSVLVFRDNIHINGYKTPYSDHPHLPCTEPFEFEFDVRLPFYDRLKTALNEAVSSLRRA